MAAAMIQPTMAAHREDIVRFCDEHPDLVDEVVTRSEEIERRGLEAYSELNRGPIEESFETLLTGLAVRYYKAVAG